MSTENFLDMDDEAIANMSFPPEESSSVDPEEGQDPSEGAEEQSEGEEFEEQHEEESAGEAEEEEGEGAEEEGAEESGSEEAEGGEEEGEASEEAGESAEEGEEEQSDETELSDAEAQLAKIMAPFKANGREIQVKTPEEAITLMQMGANYNKKMAGLKPHLKMLKMLDNNGLLSEEKLSFLIDVDKKDPSAITKLIKDSGIDPLEIDVTSETEYRPNTYNVDDREVELDSVISDIKESPKYEDTLALVSNKWDDQSKQIAFNQPHVIKTINSHMENGIFDEVMAEVDRQRALGGLQGMPDLAAYKTVGDQLEQAGAFAKFGIQPTGQPAKKTAEKSSARNTEEVNRKRRAAAPTRSAPAKPKKRPADFNPLSLSDEDFEKEAAKLSINL